MIDLNWINITLSAMAWWQIIGIIIIGFGAMYFSLAGFSLLMTQKILPALEIGSIIDMRPLRRRQIRNEICYSSISIIMFALYGGITLLADRIGWINIDWFFTPGRFMRDLIVLFFWNEIHFYACHRLLHTPWLFRYVHQRHHRSIVPTPFSTYSFHWFEAVLLSSVMITCMVFYDLSFAMVLFFPAFSLLINNIGHMNYAIFPNKPATYLFASCKRHTLHHTRIHGNFGFFLPWIDRFLRTNFEDLSDTKV